jgi:predicted 3-demethylubiquinone-9 3-methyltransferase (glyoxalase superfamily)
METISPFLWFDSEARQAANLYVSLFENSSITAVSTYPDGRDFVVSFVLDGRGFQAMNAGPGHEFSDAISFYVRANTQERIDELWDALTADGGAAVQCGWLVDRYGLSWQIVPDRLSELLEDPDPGRAGRAMSAMMQMEKIVIADLELAADTPE